MASLPGSTTGGPLRSPYREDEIEPQREPFSLRLPWVSHGATASGRGDIVGVQRASDLRDLAVVETVFEASKFQRIRRLHVPSFSGGAPLLLSPVDLRQYRRAVEPEQLLALLLDHTCRNDWVWLDALLPYLRWAYTSRAKVCLVQVGRRAAPDQLQAERTMARNVLDPRVRAALDAPPGSATPLAHGLDLLFQAIRHVLQHGRTTVRGAWLVVVTDGRGNVPLEDSRAGSDRSPIASGDSYPIGRTGVDDALRVAEQLRSLKRVQKVLIDPAPTPYPELPTTFAESLGAVLVAGRTADVSFESGAHVD